MLPGGYLSYILIQQCCVIVELCRVMYIEDSAIGGVDIMGQRASAVRTEFQLARTSTFNTAS